MFEYRIWLTLGVADPGSAGPWEWRTLGVVDPGSGGPWEWRTLGVADPGSSKSREWRTLRVVNPGSGGPWEWRTLGVADPNRPNRLPRQEKFRAMNGVHLASPIRGELGYAHWPQLGTQFIARLGTKFGAH